VELRVWDEERNYSKKKVQSGAYFSVQAVQCLDSSNWGEEGEIILRNFV
jgi:hypothetical protein